MIVVSGGLVLVAIAFLIYGLIDKTLPPVYISIGVSIVAAIFLLLGALQRRGEETASGAPAPAPEPAGGDPLERVGAVTVSRAEAADDAGTPDTGELDEEFADALGPQVAIVPGRPRYHVATCRFLAGRGDVEAVPVDAARDQGYTPCGVCKPDQMVEAALAAAAADDSETVASDLGGDFTEEPEPAVASLDETVADEPVEEVVATPAKRARATKRTAAAATASTATVDAEPASEAVTAAAEAAPKKATRAATQVVVIPDRGKFHAPACRFVRDVPGTVTVSKTTAKRQGYEACGVCKP